MTQMSFRDADIQTYTAIHLQTSTLTDNKESLKLAVRINICVTRCA